MPVYEFEVTQKILVECEDEAYAQEVAEDSVAELDWQAYDVIFLREVKNLSQLSDGWDGRCFPYGGNKRLSDTLPE